MYCEQQNRWWVIDDKRAAFKNAQKTIGKIMREKEYYMEGIERKQQMMDELLNMPPNNQLNHLKKYQNQVQKENG